MASSSAFATPSTGPSHPQPPHPHTSNLRPSQLKPHSSPLAGVLKRARNAFNWSAPETDFFLDNLLVRIHFIVQMIWKTGLGPWEFEFPFPGSLTSTFLGPYHHPSRYDQIDQHRCWRTREGPQRLQLVRTTNWRASYYRGLSRYLRLKDRLQMPDAAESASRHMHFPPTLQLVRTTDNW